MDLDLGDTRKLIEVARGYGVLRNQTAYILATGKWETNHTMKPVREAYWLSESWRKSNLRYFPWYGRGYIQLTWEYNYKKADDTLKLGDKLLKNPDLAMDPEIATQTAVVGMIEGWFTGKKLSDYITLQKSNFVGARRIINGTDRAYDIAEIAKAYDKQLKKEYDWS